MRKRILSILLTLCMVLCLVPTSVFAEGEAATGTAAIQFGIDVADVLNKNINTASAATVYFGQDHENNPVAWRVIGYDGNSAAGNMTLLAANNMGLSKFGASNAYADSELKEAIDALADKLTAKETDAVEKRTLASGNYDEENTDGVAGPAVSNAVFWPLSSKEANAVNNDLRVVDPEHPGWASSYWWLRSPDEDYSTAFVAGRGEVRYYGGYSTSKEFGVRPAFDLNLDSVLFASAAVGGKPDGGLQPVSPNYTGNEWKLTLYDSKRNDFSRTTWEVSASTKGGTVEISYTDAKTGANEYISALIFDDVGNVIYYGRSNASLTEKDGTAQLTIPAGFAEGTYTLKVFNEQYNGDRKTDLASGFADVTLTVEKRVDEQFTLAPGGRYYFDLSAMDIPGTVNSNLPDSTLHYVPFTYAGTVDAYSMENETDTAKQPYEHSLFIADYNVKCSLQRETLAEMNLIYGQTYTASNVNYTLRAPSVGDHHRNEGEGSGLAPIDNEWDTIYQKSADYIKNWYKMRSFGQDIGTGNVEGMYLSRGGHFAAQATFWARPTLPERDIGFRPVLELPTDLAADSLKIVELLTGEFMPGEQQNWINIIVKKGESFKAPSAEGLPRPDAASENALLWWTDGNGAFYRPGDTVPADVSELLLVCDYDVTYLPGAYGAGEPMTESKRHNVALTLRGALFTRTGYTQVGWATVDGGEKVYGLDAVYTQNEALTLYPVWNTNKYTITFDTNGGSEIAPITQDYGTAITAPADPAREGYTFIGWDKAIPATMPAENVTVTAQWEINRYTVTFDTAGGSEIAPITQDYGTAIAAPADPTREGYTFIGWDREIPANMPAENVTLTAQWEINRYTVTFDTNGGSEIAPITQDYGTAITAPADPTREGYTFIGWDREIPATMPAENVTVTAQWQLAARMPDRELVIYYKSVGRLNTITEDPSLVEYTSSDESVVTVDKDGNYKAVGRGNAVITMHIVGTDIEEHCKITVKYAWWQVLIRIFLLGFIWY